MRSFLGALFAVLACTVALFVYPQDARAGEKDYALGVFPFLPPTRLQERFGGYAGALAKALDRYVEFRTRSTFEAFQDEIKAQTYDIIFVQPFDYIVAADSYGYLPLASANEPLRAIIVVKKGSQLQSLNDLRHKTVALPPHSAAVSRLAVSAFEKLGMVIGTDIAMLHLRTHSACLQALLIGKADACATNLAPLRVFSLTRDVSFRMLGESDAIPHVLFAIHERVPKRDREIMRRTILALGESKPGNALLEKSGWPTGFVAANDDDYDIIRTMSRK